MEPFATVEQYDARYPGREVSDEMLTECLMDATRAITAVLDKNHVDWSEPSEDFADRLMSVCRSVANRILPSGMDVPVGATQMSVTAGSYQRQFSMPGSYGTPKLIDSELSMLGLNASRVGWAPLGG